MNPVQEWLFGMVQVPTLTGPTQMRRIDRIAELYRRNGFSLTVTGYGATTLRDGLIWGIEHDEALELTFYAGFFTCSKLTYPDYFPLNDLDEVLRARDDLQGKGLWKDEVVT